VGCGALLTGPRVDEVNSMGKAGLVQSDRRAQAIAGSRTMQHEAGSRSRS
jgi:hypothetical protein